jgi:hypothetical protein
MLACMVDQDITYDAVPTLESEAIDVRAFSGI